MEHIREMFPPHSPQLPSENSHGFASEALSLLLVEGGPNNHALHGDVGDGGKAWLFHVFSTYCIFVKFLKVCGRSLTFSYVELL